MKRYDMEDVGPAYHQHTEMIECEDGLWVDYDDVKAELAEVQKIVVAEPLGSLLVLVNFSDTSVGGDLMTALNASSAITKDHIHKTAAIGISGIKSRLGDLLSRLTGQPLKYFNDEVQAKNWLVKEN